MKRRYFVLGLTVVLALSLAATAFGGVTDPIATEAATVKAVAKRALKLAKAAQSTANTALSTANGAASAAANAQSTANAANSAAGAAQGTANTALSTANSAKSAAANAQSSANAAQATANSKMSDENGVDGTAVNASGSPATADANVTCPTGQKVTGGGFLLGGTDNNQAVVTDSFQYGDAWIADAKEINGQAGTSWSILATVDCAVSP